jgi:hypothetical protein
MSWCVGCEIGDPSGNLIQVTRSSIAPSALSILNVTPATSPKRTTITIQGQGSTAGHALPERKENDPILPLRSFAALLDDEDLLNHSPNGGPSPHREHAWEGLAVFHPLVSGGQQCRVIARQHGSPVRGGPSQHFRVVSALKSRLLHADNVKRGSAPEQPAHNWPREVFIRKPAHFGLRMLVPRKQPRSNTLRRPAGLDPFSQRIRRRGALGNIGVYVFPVA